MIDFIKILCRISHRFGKKETEAAEVIEHELSSHKIPFHKQPFKTAVPICIKAELKADGRNVPCLGASLISGSIPDGKYIISAFGYSGERNPYNINYNPVSDQISVIDFSRVPSVTVSRLAIPKLVMAKKVTGRVVVNKQVFTSQNMLLGNSKNPKNIVFAHYDSVVGDGALDNAGGVSVMLNAFLEKPELLDRTLFVFAGNEEVSYDDYKNKSGFGFRVFESQYSHLLSNSEMIIVIDGVGIGEPLFSQNALQWALQVKILDKIKDKVFWLQNDQRKVFQLLHTKGDTVDHLEEKHLEAACNALVKKLIA